MSIHPCKDKTKSEISRIFKDVRRRALTVCEKKSFWKAI